jgi:hypothetical protein
VKDVVEALLSNPAVKNIAACATKISPLNSAKKQVKIDV